MPAQSLFYYAYEHARFRDVTELSNKEIEIKCEAIDLALELGQKEWHEYVSPYEGEDGNFARCAIKQRINALLEMQQTLNEFLVNPLAFFVSS